MTSNPSDAGVLHAKREAAIVAGIRRGLADMEAGRTVPHAEAMAEIDRLNDSIAKDRPLRPPCPT